MDIHWLDGLILVIILISLITGAWRGFIKEVLSLVAWVAAFLIARAMSPDMAVLLKPHISSNSINLLVSWLIPFLGTFIVFHFLKMLLISVITLVGLRPVDRLFGAVFGAARGILHLKIIK